jgi:hypothetical protein
VVDYKRFKIITFSLLVFAIIFLQNSNVFASKLTTEKVAKDLSQETNHIFKELEKSCRISPSNLPAKLPAEFKMIQQGKMNIPGKYMSETEPIKKALDACKNFIEANPGSDLSDVLIANFLASKLKYKASKNCYLILDSIIINETLDRWTSDKKGILRLLKTRRDFSDYNHTSTQQYYLKAPFKKKAAQLPPKMVQGLQKIISKFPGQLGKAIRDTLNLLGIEDLTASIFANHSLERLTTDPKLRARIILLHSILKDQLNSPNKKTKRNLWAIAKSISANAGEAMELLGVFCTQHRTLIKTIMPRTESREAQLPLVEPLIRCASNFFLIVENNEVSKNAKQGYRFAYPKGYNSHNWKFYHFWSEAYVAWSLLQKGYSQRVVKTVCHNLARGYESYTLPKNIKYAIKSKSSIIPMIADLRDDIKAHIKGTNFAIKIWNETHQK